MAHGSENRKGLLCSVGAEDELWDNREAFQVSMVKFENITMRLWYEGAQPPQELC